MDSIASARRPVSNERARSSLIAGSGDRATFSRRGSASPFSDQPSSAQCSGVLIDDDLVLTAAHCLRALPCEEWRLVFGFYYIAPGVLNAIRSEDVFSSGVLRGVLARGAPDYEPTETGCQPNVE